MTHLIPALISVAAVFVAYQWGKEMGAASVVEGVGRFAYHRQIVRVRLLAELAGNIRGSENTPQGERGTPIEDSSTER